MRKPKFQVGQRVEWSRHPGRLAGIVRGISFGHFHDIELLRPSAGQSPNVRLIGEPLRAIHPMVNGNDYVTLCCERCKAIITTTRYHFNFEMREHDCGGRLEKV